jgi:hypothetical protein
VKTAILASAFLLLLQSAASANTLSYTATVPTQTTDYTQSVSLQQFDSTLGTLNSITVELGGDFSITNLTFTNNSSSEQTFTAESGVRFSASGGGLTFSSFNTGTLLVSANDGNDIVVAGNSTSINYASPPLTNSGSTTSNVALSNFALYQGTGNIAFNFRTQTSTTILGGGGNIAFLQSTVAGGYVKVTYNFTAVPEPSVPVFGGLLVVGFALVGRRYGQVRLESPLYRS